MPTIQQQNMQDIAQEAAERMRKVALENVNNSLEMSYNALVTSLAESVARLPEVIFTSRFLPFFTGQRPLADYPGLFTDWISIAGAPNREVAIIDNNGIELYRVPPLLNTEIVTLNRSGNFNEIFDQYELRSRQLPVVGQRFLAEAMAAKSKQLTANTTHSSSRETAWLAIFARYGLTPNTKVTNHVPVSLSVDDDLEYE